MNKINPIVDNLAKIPKSSGVYQYFDEHDNVLYIGKAKNLQKRVASYAKIGQLSNRIRKMVSLIARIETTTTKTELEALLLEHNLIKKLAPKYNILLKDDKTFPLILIDKKHNFGRIAKHRGTKKADCYHFGPFASGFDVNKTIDLLKKHFLLRGCSDEEFKSRKKPCLEYQIKKCSAPCVALISKDEYQKSINLAVDFLNGKSVKIQEELAQKMQQFSDTFEYEKAALIRDKIKSLSAIQSKQIINLASLGNTDVIVIEQIEDMAIILLSFYRGGNNYGSKSYFYKANDGALAEFLEEFIGQFYLEQIPPENVLLNIAINSQNLMADYLSQLAECKVNLNTPKQGEKYKIIQNYQDLAKKDLQKKLVENATNKEMFLQLKKLFNLEKIPEKIEVYDNSHISGEHAVGAMICANKDGFLKKNYRIFNLNLVELAKKDDTAMLKEVLMRRFTRLINEDATKELGLWPSLVIIDGGKGQLSAAQEIFTNLNIVQPLVCMSKGENRNAGEEYFHQIGQQAFTLPKNHQIMFFLQRLRDEAHRFAIGSHRNKRAKSITKSGLDNIDSIGKKRKKDLLNYFGSLENIKSATVEDLERITGISQKTARKIKDYFN